MVGDARRGPRRGAIRVLAGLGIGAVATVTLIGGGGVAGASPASPCGASGVLSGAGPFMCTYDAVGSDSFTVPAGVARAEIRVVGAVGGNYFVDGDAAHPDPGGAIVGRGGGAGGGASGTLSLTPGQVLQVDIAGAGATGTPAGRSGGMMNGPSGGLGGRGGSGGSAGGSTGATGDAAGGSGGTAFNGGDGGGGGGSSDVRLDPAGCGSLSCGPADRVLVGAGGGGAGGTGGQGNAIGGAGGDGGGASGNPGASMIDGANAGVPGGGGTPASGGAGGLEPGLNTAGAVPGDPRYGGNGSSGSDSGSGGAGGAGNLPCTGTQTPACSGGQNNLTSGGGGGGGAGGGHFGGGGGSGGGGLSGGGGGAGGGGGGGSSFVTPSATNPGLDPAANANTSAVTMNPDGTASYTTNGSINSGNGEVTIAWTTTSGLASPSLSSTASGQVAVGGQISDSATLAGGATPSGEITFQLFGPGDVPCATPLTSSTATVAGDGTYQSAPFTPAAAGTYRWIAAYGAMRPTTRPAGHAARATSRSSSRRRSPPRP